MTKTGQLTSGILSMFCSRTRPSLSVRNRIPLTKVIVHILLCNDEIKENMCTNLVNVEPKCALDRIHDAKARKNWTVQNHSPQVGQSNGQFQSRSTPYRLSVQYSVFLFHTILLFKAFICSLYICICVLLTWLICILKKKMLQVLSKTHKINKENKN